jgi:molybdate transport system substrate-binding protein
LSRRLALAALAASVVGSGCGESGDDPLTVAAASSLTEAFPAYDSESRYSFAGSDALAAQIRDGAPVDVFASANTDLPHELHEEGLVEEPVEFARNELVLAVPIGSDISSLDELARSNADLVIGAEGVPVGDYTREVLGRLDAEQRGAILARVRSEEPEVKGIIGKLVAGAADAGFVYGSDVRAAVDDLTAVALPRELRPAVVYGIAVVTDSDQPDEAADFIAGIRGVAGSEALLDAGFNVP